MVFAEGTLHLLGGVLTAGSGFVAEFPHKKTRSVQSAEANTSRMVRGNTSIAIPVHAVHDSEDLTREGTRCCRRTRAAGRSTKVREAAFPMEKPSVAMAFAGAFHLNPTIVLG